jgi:hypothetical protein
MIEDTLKTCGKCKEAKPLTAFFLDHRRGIPRSECKLCYKIAGRISYWKDPGRERDRRAAIQRKITERPANSRATQLGPVLSASFWSFVDAKGQDECWEWRGARTRQRYGIFRMFRCGAHRLAYELHHGILLPTVPVVTPESPVILHKCDNPPCCNPFHLWLGTTGDNARDRNKKGRQRDGFAWKQARAARGAKLAAMIVAP